MTEVRPFTAIRYDFAALNGEVTSRLAPPYDILDQADKDRLLRNSDRNIVKIDMPHVPPGFEGPAERYAEAAQTLRDWLADGTLVRERTPALYHYHQHFTHEGRRYTRKMFFAAVRLQPFEDRVILPHEHTFGGPKADRLALMKATRCALSPVFGLYQDATGKIDGAFDATAQRSPDAVGTLEGVENQVWTVTDPNVVKTVCHEMTDKHIYIADGHHRYTTALNYRDGLIADGAELADGHPARFALFVLANMDDPGCLVLPTHRVFTELAITSKLLVDAWADGCRACESAAADITVFDGRTKETLPLSFTRRTLLNELEPTRSPAWRALDLAYLHRYLIDELLTRRRLGGKAPSMTYAKSDEQARSLALDGPATAVFVKPTQMSDLRDVCEADDLMPHKSTFFYPKLANGLALMSLS